ncbi:MAG: cysteine--tRNA ligase [Alphaproteobacteria bacterium]|nr:cysteine--tRNA ligase [Alphaproteobacteria bacterium]
MTTLSLYNTLTRRKEAFTPLDSKNVRMYVCGPTVYDRPHLGNARSTVVYDVLFRVLREIYGKEHVTYARNITDVDDKINAAAKQNGEPISALTKRVEGWFHDDIAALNCLPPTHEPRATAHIKEMIAISQKLISEGHAYAADGHVLFAVDSYQDYGALSGRRLDELIAGARIEVESYKKHPGDFVLWKPAESGDDPSSVFDSPWGRGRPGWHIECSAMSSKYLGTDFDIHGGGADLMFPHHENEIAQSRCSAKGSHFARYWVHNGFLTVGGEKMSKSLGNFTTVKDVLDKGVPGEVIRLAYLMTKYNEPLDWNEKLLTDAKKILDGWYRQIGIRHQASGISEENLNPQSLMPNAFFTALCDDLNTPRAISMMHSASPDELKAMTNLLGLLQQNPDSWFKGESSASADGDIQAKIDARIAAKKAKNWSEADRIRKELADSGILLEDRPDGTTDWRRA